MRGECSLLGVYLEKNSYSRLVKLDVNLFCANKEKSIVSHLQFQCVTAENAALWSLDGTGENLVPTIVGAI